MKRKPYPSDLSDAQWAILEPLIPEAKQNGRPRRVYLREIINAIFYVVVSAANVSEKAGVLLILEKIVAQFPRLVKVFADGGDEGKDFNQKVKDDHHLNLEVVKRKHSKGFQVLPGAMDSRADSGMDSTASTTDD